MEVTTTLGPVTVLSVSGQIDDRTFATLVREAEEALNTGYVRLVLDLGGVDYVSSAGLIALQTIAMRAASRDGKMVLCCLGKKVSQVLGLTGFDRTLAIFPDVAAAKASFGTGEGGS
jgi:anti-sigma B factor antagonist